MHPIRVFSSHDEYYDRVFTLFINSTDQKQQADTWLRDFLSQFPANQRAVDAGAGNGILTRPVAEHFAEVVAVEPNPSLLAELAASGANIRILPDTIEEAPVENARAEFVLCSHVLYYVPRPEWENLLHRLLSWVQPGGTLIVVLQAENTDCMKFYTALRGHGFPITQCMEEFSHQPEVASVNIVRQPSRIQVQSDG
jgi:2-polyprenyl-3-methyl-5-hydroxy-6-metoxy-1,4-benzoquinol methylase